MSGNDVLHRGITGKCDSHPMRGLSHMVSARAIRGEGGVAGFVQANHFHIRHNMKNMPGALKMLTYWLLCNEVNVNVCRGPGGEAKNVSWKQLLITNINYTASFLSLPLYKLYYSVL